MTIEDISLISGIYIIFVTLVMFTIRKKINPLKLEKA